MPCDSTTLEATLGLGLYADRSAPSRDRPHCAAPIVQISLIRSHCAVLTRSAALVRPHSGDVSRLAFRKSPTSNGPRQTRCTLVGLEASRAQGLTSDTEPTTDSHLLCDRPAFPRTAYSSRSACTGMIGS